MSGGYTASGDAMRTASKKIGDLAEALPDTNSDMQNPEVTADGFGRVHKQHADAYTKAAGTLWAALSGYGSTLGAYGQNISSAATSYAENEDTQGTTIGNAGGF